MATEAAQLEGKESTESRKTVLTVTGLLTEGLWGGEGIEFSRMRGLNAAQQPCILSAPLRAILCHGLAPPNPHHP
jgi:hypothetical protein